MMRPGRNRYRMRAALLLAATALPAAAQVPAPTPDSAPLYRVELLIITHEGNLGAERWEPVPDLAYPTAARFLVDPARLDNNLEEFPGEAELDPYGRHLITMPPEPDPDAEPADPDAEPGDGAAGVEADAGEALAAGVDSGPEAEPVPDADPALEPDPGPDAEPEPEPEPLVRPFHLLDPAEHELSTWGVRRSGRHQVLFHQAWIQPVAERAQALPIVLDRSGDSGEWPPWQGSVLLYLSRYLHLETNLWLNTDGGYFPEGWSLPPAPLGPPSVLVDGMPPYRYREAKLAEALAREAAEEEAGAYPALPGLTEGQPAPTGPGPQPPQDEAQGAGYPGLTPSEDGMAAVDGELAEEPEAAADPPWPWRHAVLVSERRRMRSEEVHYLDHPLLGLVIKLTPVDLEALEAERAAAQQLSAIGSAVRD